MAIKKALIIGITAIAIVLSPVFVFSQQDKYGLSDTVRDTKLKDISISKMTPESLTGQVIQLILGFVAIIFFLLMLYGGVMWMMAKGSNEQVEKAKSILEMAVIGLVIVVASYAISTFIFSRLTSSPIVESPSATTE